MTYHEAVKSSDTDLLPLILELYGLEGCEISRVQPHEGGRNVVYACGENIVRIAFLGDRSREDFLAEVEFVRYLAEYGASVANVIASQNGNLLEELTHDGRTFYICVFERARGKQLVENNYRYREGAPLSEYFYNCGKVLGKMHQLSKEYVPVHRRYDWSDKTNAGYIGELVPDSSSRLKARLLQILKDLEGLDRGRAVYGMIHNDYSDGNYNIDFGTGRITVYDFDDACFGWYMYELANVWIHGVGWVRNERSARKRKKFMDEYFAAVLAGYRSETDIGDDALALLPLFIDVTLMGHIVEIIRDNLERRRGLRYLRKCLEKGIPYAGIFKYRKWSL